MPAIAPALLPLPRLLLCTGGGGGATGLFAAVQVPKFVLGCTVTMEVLTGTVPHNSLLFVRSKSPSRASLHEKVSSGSLLSHLPVHRRLHAAGCLHAAQIACSWCFACQQCRQGSSGFAHLAKLDGMLESKELKERLSAPSCARPLFWPHAGIDPPSSFRLKSSVSS